jgi:hypothetical protein
LKAGKQETKINDLMMVMIKIQHEMTMMIQFSGKINSRKMSKIIVCYLEGRLRLILKGGLRLILKAGKQETQIDDLIVTTQYTVQTLTGI